MLDLNSIGEEGAIVVGRLLNYLPTLEVFSCSDTCAWGHSLQEICNALLWMILYNTNI